MSAQAKRPENYEFVHTLLVEHGAGRHLDTSEILAYARRARPNFSTATLYRALRRLADEGLVAELLLPGAPAAVYEIAESEHAHFRCSNCLTVVDVPFTIRPAVVRELAARAGVTMDGVTISFRGRCAHCTQHANI